MLRNVTVTLDLSPAVMQRLEAEAARRGVSVEDVIAELTDRLAADGTPKRKLAFVGAAAFRSGRSARDADELLAEGFGRD